MMNKVVWSTKFLQSRTRHGKGHNYVNYAKHYDETMPLLWKFCENARILLCTDQVHNHRRVLQGVIVAHYTHSLQLRI